jgi:phosphohistidine swiveling domain-containing protein
MDKVVFTFKDPSAQTPSLSGNKGATLAKMSKVGLPIPSGFIISTKAFQTISRKVSTELKAYESLKKSDLTALENASGKIRTLIREHDLSPDIISQLKKAYNALGQPAVSIRSSATDEDLAHASFAGQYDTFLNVCNLNDLIQNLKNVWASLYSPHAIDYRQKNKIPNNKAKMAVVVQEQIDPHAAGVLFTQDPVSGAGHYVISAALGLGEGVVSGAAQTDRFVLHAKTGKRLSSDISSKEAKIVSNKKGGIETVPVAKTQKDKPALTQTQLTHLAAFGRQLSRLFKCPQDIEFAVTGNTLHILQSRPMTAIEPVVEPDKPWNASLNPKHHWRYRGGPYHRLEEEYTRERLDQMRVCYQETGSSMTYTHIPHLTNGYVFVTSNKHSKKTLEKLHAKQTRLVNACLKQGKSYFEGALQSLLEDRLAELKRRHKTISNFSDLVDYLEAAIKTGGYVQGNLHWRQGKPGGRPDWPAEYHKITGRPPLEAHTFTQAVQNRMTRLITRIRELARIVQKDPKLRQIFIERQFDNLASPDIQNRKNVNLFHTKFQSMLRVYGLRAGHGYGTSSNFATPTWNMDNTLAYEMIASYAEQNLNRLDKLEHEARAERISITRQTQRQLANDPKKLKRFNNSLKEAIIGVRFLEDHNYYMEQCTVGTMREAVFEVGSEMVKQNLIDTPDDVFHFSIADLKKIARDKNPGDQRALVHDRKEELEHRKKMKPPQTLGTVPKASETKKEENKEIGLHGKTITGTGASRGRVTGKAVVALPNKPRPKVHPGDILVAPNVGPDWTPAFAIIGGLVLDSGSLSQHAALVAREYRVPSVMQTKEASKVIQDGQTITVDGDNGIVELVS